MRSSLVAACCAAVVMGCGLLATPAAAQGLRNVSPTLDDPTPPDMLAREQGRPPQRRATVIRPASEAFGTRPAGAEAASGPQLGPAFSSANEAPASAEAAAPAETAASATVASDAAAPSTGDRLVVEAYELTKTATKSEEMDTIIKLCVEAIRAGVNEETDGYARKLASWAFNRRGELHAAAGDDAAALADFENSVKIDPTRWQAIHNRGISYALHRRYNEALKDFNQVVQMKPDYPNVYFNRGEVRYEMGELEAAIQNYSMALQLNPNDSSSLNSRGHSYYRLGDHRKAAGDFTAAIKADPTNASAYTNRGDLFADLGYYDRALADYKTALQHDPQLARAYQSIAWLFATCPDEKYRNAKGSLEAAQRALELDASGDHRYFDTLAAAQANAGQFAEARKTISQAMQAAPPETAAMYQSRLDLYAHSQPLRAKPRQLPEAQTAEGRPASFNQSTVK